MPSSLRNLQQHMHGSTNDAEKGEGYCYAPGTSRQPFHKSWCAYATWRVVGQQQRLRHPIFIRNQGAGQEAAVGQMSSQPMHAAAEYQHVAKKDVAQMSTAVPESWVARAGEPHVDDFVTASTLRGRGTLRAQNQRRAHNCRKLRYPLLSQRAGLQGQENPTWMISSLPACRSSQGNS